MGPKEVWIVTFLFNDGFTVIYGLFSTKEKAQALIKQEEEHAPPSGWQLYNATHDNR